MNLGLITALIDEIGLDSYRFETQKGYVFRLRVGDIVLSEFVFSDRDLEWRVSEPFRTALFEATVYRGLLCAMFPDVPAVVPRHAYNVLQGKIIARLDAAH